MPLRSEATLRADIRQIHHLSVTGSACYTKVAKIVLQFATLYDALIILVLAGMSKSGLLDNLVFFVHPVMLMPKLSHHLFAPSPDSL